MEHSRRTIMHPDENLLTALAERTLAPAERGRVLEHLSDCAECRDAVFLAQQAAGEPTLQTALPFPVERRIPGAPRWRWAIVSAAGLLSAALIVAPVLLHRRAGNSAKVYPTQMAASGQSTSQTQNGISPSTPSVQRPTESKAMEVLRSQAESAPKPTLSPHSSKIADSAHAGPKNTLAAASASKALTSQTTPPSNVALAMNAEVAGSVTDPSGAAIPGAKVSLRLPGATALQAITGPSGNFAISSVPPGKYTVEFNAMGFQTAVQDIDVHAQDRAALSETLALGSASESVNVSAEAAAAQLQTENSLVAETISGNAGGQLPLNGRNFTQLSKVAPQTPREQATGAAVAASSTITFFINDGIVQSCVGNACTARLLPSPSPARSVAFDARTAMVVDANGDLFSTQDIGEHWVEITPQWQGKAIALKLDSAPSGGVTHPTATPLVNGSIGGAGNGPIGGPVAGIRVAPSIFELTNEQGQVWLSSDEGQTWHLK